MTDIDTSKSLSERIRIGMPPTGISAIEWDVVYSAARRLCGPNALWWQCQPNPTLATTMRAIAIKPPFVTFGEWDGLAAQVERGTGTSEPSMDRILGATRRIFNEENQPTGGDAAVGSVEHGVTDGALLIFPETTTTPIGAVKFDNGKPSYSLLPSDALAELVRVYDIGAKKYGRENWAQGFDYHRVFDAMMRHAFAWLGGERDDPVDGQMHMASVAWGALTLVAFDLRGIGTDDRPVIQKGAQ